MKKIFKHLLVLMVMFMLPMFVLAEETTKFDHIDIDPTVSLKYTVLGEVKTYPETPMTLDSSLAGLNIYRLAQDGTKTRIDITSDNLSLLEDGKYRLSGEFDKYYSDETDYKYLVEYEFEVTVQGATKTITYSKEYSYSSEQNGILVDLTSEDSIKTFAPSIVINKKVKLNTPDGTFAFKITKGDGTSQTVNVTTKGASDQNEGVGSETIYLDLNTTYTIEEIEDTTKVYELESISSNRDTDSAVNTVTVTTGNSIDDVIEINVVNKSKVDHSKTIQDNGDGTYQLSLDVTGENEKNPANKANVVVILDISGSMDNETGNTISQMYNAVAPGDDNLYGIDNNGNYFALTRQIDYSGNVYYTYRSGWSNVTYTGILYERTTKETRMIAAREAVKSLANSLLGNNTTENPDVVKMALVTFSTNAETIVNPTVTYSTIETAVNKTYAYGGTNWEDALQKAMAINFGSDREATTYYIFVSDGNPTFRETADNSQPLPLTDNAGWYSIDGYGRIQEARVCNANGYCYYPYELYKNDDSYYDSDGVYGLGNDTQYKDDGRYNYNYSPTSMERCYDHAKDDARLIVNGETDTNGNVTKKPAILYTIGAYGNVNRMQALTNYAYTGSDTTAPEDTYYYSASNTSDLNQAFRDILEAIERSGIGAVTINDGTTQSVTTSAGVSNLLTVDESSYEYWLTFPVTNNNRIKFNDTEVTVTKNSDNTYRLTWTDNGTEKYVDINGESYFYTDKDGNKFFVYKWGGSDVSSLSEDEQKLYGANQLYNVNPPQANLENGSVNWVLSKENVGLLLDGVTYSVTFNVWPSQYTYDLISDLDNGIIKYKDLDENIKKYLIYEDGSYTLYTNTTATLRYDDSRDDDGERTTTFANPEPVATGVSDVYINKVWRNGIDDRYATSIEIYLTRDGEKYGDKDGTTVLPYTLTKADDWTKLIYIAPGHISVNGDTAIVHEIGHDYSFEEKPSDAYYWDLVVNTLHPMKINNKVTMLIKTDDSLTEAELNILNSKNYLEKGSDKYYRIYSNVDHDYAIYKEVTGDEANFISAINYRRSYLNITKKVDGICDPDTLFEFTLVVNDSTSTETNKKDVWFSIWDGTGYVLNTSDATYVDNATLEIIKEEGTITGIVDNGDGSISYYDNGVAKTVDFCKVEDGSYYTGFYYAPSGKTITARMKAGWNLRFINLPYNSTYTFNEVLSYVLGNNVRVSDAFDLTKVELNIVQKNDKGSTVTNSTGTISVATATANANSLVNNYKIDEYNTQYTIIYTNSPKTTSREVIKTWEEDTINTRPDNITVHLYGDGVKMYTQTINSADNWRYTWNNLPIYNAQGKEINYTVTEDSVTNYITVIRGLNITNYYNLRDITATKIWENSAKTPKVVVRLTSDRGYNNPQSLENGNWTYTWTVDKYYLDNEGNRHAIEYTLEEVSINDIELNDSNIVYDWDSYIKSTIGKWLSSVTGNMNQGFRVTNTYTKYDTSITFKKMSFTDYNNKLTNGLNGAVFRLYKYVGNAEYSSNTPITDLENPGDDWIYVDTVMSVTVDGVDGIMQFNKIKNKDGSLYLDGLYEGEYRLVEIQAPARYVTVGGQWRLIVDLDKDTDSVTLRAFANYDPDYPVSIGKTTGITTDNNGNIIVLNEEVPNIPTTGGIGIPHYNNFGLLMMILSVVIYLVGIVNQRKQIENI